MAHCLFWVAPARETYRRIVSSVHACRARCRAHAKWPGIAISGTESLSASQFNLLGKGRNLLRRGACEPLLMGLSAARGVHLIDNIPCSKFEFRSFFGWFSL